MTEKKGKKTAVKKKIARPRGEGKIKTRVKAGLKLDYKE